MEKTLDTKLLPLPKVYRCIKEKSETALLGNPASFIEFEAGRQLSSGFSFGAIVHFMVSDINRSSQNQTESMSSLWYAGTRLQYGAEIRSGISLYGGSTFGIGITNHRKDEFDLSTEGGFVIGIRPEIGTRITLTDVIRINVGINVFYGQIVTRSESLLGIPALRIGFRLGR
ncbi:MAG: hypothetical protein WD059_11395 [Balneolaceae bacterium]